MNFEDKKRLEKLLNCSCELNESEIKFIMNESNSMSTETEECNGDDTATTNIISVHDKDGNLLVELAEETCTDSVNILEVVEL